MSDAARLNGLRAELLNLLRVEEEANAHPTKLENLIRYASEEATEQLHRANEPGPDEPVDRERGAA